MKISTSHLLPDDNFPKSIPTIVISETKMTTQKLIRPVSCCCRIFWLHLCKGVRTLSTNVCFGYDTKPSDGEASVQELWVMWSTPSLPLLPSPLRPLVVAPVRVASMGQTELFNLLLWIIIYIKENLWC